MKTSTLVSFVTLGLVTTNALASVLPPVPSHDDPTSLLSPLHQDSKDNPESVLLSDEELTHKPPSTRSSRFRKQGFSHVGARSFTGSEAQFPSPELDGDNSEPISPYITPGETLIKDRNAMLFSGHNTPFISTHHTRRASADDAKDSVISPASNSFSQEDTPKHFLPTLAKRDDNEDLIDIQYLNYALVVEQLLYAHYFQALRRFSEADFQNAGFPGWVRGRFREMAEHERMHKEFLESAIIAAGSDHVQPANYDFQDQDVHSFIDTSMALESIATSAYIGILQFFNNKAYVTAEAAMLADRARQAGWINSAVRKQNPWNTAFETPLTPQQVFTLLSIFVNDQTSPKLNKALLPTGLQSFPRLTLSPRLVPGEQAEISFPYSEPTDGRQDFLYVAFMSGVEAILERVLDREERNNDSGETLKRHFVEIPRDLASRGVVYVIVMKGDTGAMGDMSMDDENVVAGPAISMFPFDADGKPI